MHLGSFPVLGCFLEDAIVQIKQPSCAVKHGEDFSYSIPSGAAVAGVSRVLPRPVPTFPPAVREKHFSFWAFPFIVSHKYITLHRIKKKRLSFIIFHTTNMTVTKKTYCNKSLLQFFYYHRVRLRENLRINLVSRSFFVTFAAN